MLQFYYNWISLDEFTALKHLFYLAVTVEYENTKYRKPFTLSLSHNISRFSTAITVRMI